MHGDKYNFVVFSDDWARHPSSSQHLFKRIANKGYKVLWVNTIGLRAPRADTFTAFRGIEKFKQWIKPISRVSENIYVLDVPMLPVMGDGIISGFNARSVAWVIRRVLKKLDMQQNVVLFASVPNAADFLGLIGESCVVYYVTDDYSHWPGGDAEKIRQADRVLSGNADLILACTEQLAKNYEDAIVVPHAVDYEHFACEFNAEIAEPDELRGIGHPRVCFFGLIYEKVDIESLYELARTLKDMNLVLIGPVKTDVSKLESLRNVHILGAKEYDRLPEYLATMDVLLLPYVINDEQIRQSGPLKIRECLALAKHIVAVNIPDLQKYSDIIRLYNTTEQMIFNVKECLSCEISESHRYQMRERIRAQTWQKRAEEIIGLINELAKVDVVIEEPNWRKYIESKGKETVVYDTRLPKVMSDVYGNCSYYMRVYRQNEHVGICQLVFQRSLLFGRRLTSLPYFDVSGILADDIVSRKALVRACERLRRRTRSKWVELRQDYRLPVDINGIGVKVRDDKAKLKLQLPEETDILWNELKPKVRNLVRKARNNKLQVISGKSELIKDFYYVYLDNMRNLGSPAHSLRFFERICSVFSDNVRVFVVIKSTDSEKSKDRKPIAAGVTFVDGDCLYIPWAASLWKYKHLSANMLLYWTMLEYAIEKGLKFFDFGRSTIDSGTYRFKKQWGACEFPLYWHYIGQFDTDVSDLKAESDKYRFFIKLWTRMPIWLTRLLGPKLISKLA